MPLIVLVLRAALIFAYYCLAFLYQIGTLPVDETFLGCLPLLFFPLDLMVQLWSSMVEYLTMFPSSDEQTTSKTQFPRSSVLRFFLHQELLMLSFDRSLVHLFLRSPTSHQRCKSIVYNILKCLIVDCD